MHPCVAPGVSTGQGGLSADDLLQIAPFPASTKYPGLLSPLDPRVSFIKSF